MLAIRLPAKVEARLEALAKATGRTKTFYAREAILASLCASATARKCTGNDKASRPSGVLASVGIVEAGQG